MGGALTHIANDETRGRNYHFFLERLIDYLKNPSKKSYAILKKAAEETDYVSSGYFGGRTSLTEGLQDRVQRLSEGDKREWARTLWSLGEDPLVYNQLKKMSPFKGKILIKVDYGCGFVTVKSRDLDNLIREKNFKTYDADDYLIAISEVEFKKLDVVWTRCGIPSINGPRNFKGRRRK